jgi:hypothetical protein
MAQVLDAAQIKVRLIARSTGLNERLVVAYLVSPVPLTKETLMFIEDRRGLPRGALSSYEGRSLDDLWTNELVYGGDRVETVGGGTAVVAAPFVTAIAGFMLAAEAVKYVLPAAAQWRLGPSGVATKYEEGPYASPEYARLSSPPRWAGSECICRSIRRTRILYARYGLGQAQA